MTILAVDGDVIAYKAATICEHPIHWGEGLWTLHSFEADVKRAVDEAMGKLLDESGCKDVCTAISSETNYRKDVAHYYKANRKDTRKPMLLNWAKEYLMETYNGEKWDNLEGDDVLGILGSMPDSPYVIWSIDKDLQTIPARHFTKDGLITITEEEADRYFLYQTLIGDITDNYQGCPKIGPKTAEKLFDKWGVNWTTVITAYMNAGLGEEVAIENARLARILRHGEYDKATGKVTLWTP